ncbi:MAG: hypothetical protein ABIH42_06840, partial [Planctomycetota bacterium]
MGVSVRYCDNCGIRIDPRSIDSGEAYVDNILAYCPKCAPALAPVEEAAPAEQPPRAPAPTPVFVQQQRKRPTGVIKKKVDPARYKIKKEHKIEERRQTYGVSNPYEKKRLSPVLKGVLIGGIVFLVIIVAMILLANKENRDPYKEEPVSTRRQIDDEPVKIVTPPKPIDIPIKDPVAQRGTPADERWKEISEFVEKNPEEYNRIVELMESAQREFPELAPRVNISLPKIMGTWERKAKELFSKAEEDSKTAENEEDFEKALSVYESLSDVCKKYPACMDDIKEQIEKLKQLKNAKAEYEEIKVLLESIDPSLGIEKLREIREQAIDFTTTYIGTIYEEKLEEQINKLVEMITDIEREAWTQEQKEREEKERAEREKKEKEKIALQGQNWEEQRALIDAVWIQSGLDKTALAALEASKAYRLCNNVDTNGWISGGNKNCTWEIKDECIVGINSSTEEADVLMTNYKQQYFWENYSFECNVYLVKGSGSVIVRCGVLPGLGIIGGIEKLTQNEWV